MRLIIVRHGKAKPESPTGRDEDRPLRPRGVRQAQRLAEALRDADHTIRAVHASPALRAQQTARVLADTLGAELIDEPRFGLNADVNDVLELIAGAAAASPTLTLVGHNPTCAVLVALLLRGPGAIGSLGHRTGEAAILDLPDPANAIGAARLVARLRFDDAETP
ncbi:MAG: histidine phosphatase family protein [Planctomycetota bacterium]